MKMKSKDLLKLEYYVYKMGIGKRMKLYHQNGQKNQVRLYLKRMNMSGRMDITGGY